MKRIILISALALFVGLFTITSDAYSQGKGKGGPKGNKGSNSKFVDADGDGKCDNFVDADGDGKNDNCTGAGNCTGKGKNFVDADGDGKCDNFVDADGDGINDNCKKQGKGNCGKGKGSNFIDENGDGICDNFVDENGDGICDHCSKSNSGKHNGWNKNNKNEEADAVKMNNGIAFGHQKVNFNMKESGNVKMNLYDANGNMIQEVYNGNMNKGPQELTINTDNLKSGVYFYSIEFNGKTERKQFTVVK